METTSTPIIDGGDHFWFLRIFQVAPHQRINVLIVLAVWLWHWIVGYLAKHQIELSRVIQTRSPKDISSPYHNSQIKRLTYLQAVQLTKIMLPLHIASGIVYQYKEHLIATQGECSAVWTVLDNLLPSAQFQFVQLYLMRKCDVLKYCLTRLPFIQSSPKQLRNVYILVSDSLTSFSKALIDFAVFSSLPLVKGRFDHVDLVVAMLPTLNRILQCLIEFYMEGDRLMAWNALKYTSGLPILMCIWYSRIYAGDVVGLSTMNSYSLLRLFMLIHTIYSCFWDIRFDWLITSFHNPRPHNKLQGTLPKNTYRLAIILNTIIRFWWVWVMIVSYMTTGSSSDNDYLFFVAEMQYLELLRRAIWVIFKLESEHMIAQPKA